MKLSTVRLGDLVSFTRGLTYSKTSEVASGGIAVLRATNIDLTTSKLVLNEIRYIDPKIKIKKEKFVKPGDILICTASGSKSHLGKVALIVKDQGMAFGGFMAVLRCKPVCNPKFLHLILTSAIFKSHLNRISDGTNINNLKFSQIEDFRLFLPSLCEQERMAGIIDAAFAEIDSGFKSYQNKADNAENLLGRIIPNIVKKYSSTTLTSTIGDAFSLSSGQFLPRKRMCGNGLINVFGGNGIAGKHNAHNLQGENVIIGRVGAKCGNVHYVNENLWLTDNAMFIHSFNYEFDLEFLALIISELNLGRYSRQSAQPVISSSSIKDVMISFPKDIKEQKKIIKRVLDAKNKTDLLFKTYKYQCENYHALKSAILSKELQSEIA